MTNERQLIDKLTRALDTAQHRRQRTMLTGRRTGPAPDDVTLADAPAGRVWVREADDSRETTLAYGYASQPNVPVLVGEDAAGELVILRADYPAAVPVLGERAGMPVLPPIDGAVSPLNVVGQNLAMGRVERGGAPGLAVSVGPGWYPLPAPGKFLARQLVTLTPTSASGQQAFVGVYYDPALGDYQQVLGDDIPLANTVTQADAYATITWPRGVWPLGAVLLAHNATTIDETTLIVDMRHHLSINAAPALTNPNLIYNGCMTLWNGLTTLTAPASGTYDAEGFRHARAGTMVVNVARSTVVPPPTADVGRLTHSTLIRITTAQTSLGANDFLLYQHLIEGYTARAIMGRPFTLSFWVNSTTPGTYHVSIRNASADRSYVAPYTIEAPDTWQRVVIHVPTPPVAGGWNYETGVGLNIVWTLAAGTGLHTTSPNEWIADSRIATSSQINFAAAVNNDWYITGIKLEAGSIATPMLPDPYETTQLRAARYYYKSYNEGTAPGTSGVSGAAAAFAIGMGTLWGINPFPVPMRLTNPIINVWANDGTPQRVTSSAGVTTGTAALTVLAIRDRGFVIVSDTGLPFVIGALYTYNFVADARLT